MAILSTFVLSDNSNQVLNPNGQGTTLQVVNPQNIFRPMFIPGGHSFSVTFGFLEVNPDAQHRIQFSIISCETGEQVINIDNIEVPPNAQPDKFIPKESTGIMLNFDFRNVPFKKEGKYEVHITLDGETLDKKPFYVYKQGSN